MESLYPPNIVTIVDNIFSFPYLRWFQVRMNSLMISINFSIPSVARHNQISLFVFKYSKGMDFTFVLLLNTSLSIQFSIWFCILAVSGVSEWHCLIVGPQCLLREGMSCSRSSAPRSPICTRTHECIRFCLHYRIRYYYSCLRVGSCYQ